VIATFGFLLFYPFVDTGDQASARRAPLAFDPATVNVVLFGEEGSYGGPTLGDIWTWDGPNWTQQSPVNSPPVRSMASMAHDASSGYTTSGQLVLFGGCSSCLRENFLHTTTSPSWLSPTR
jgi:hypothetical protein